MRTSGFIEALKWYSIGERAGYPGAWPVHHFVFHRHRDTFLESDLATAGYRIVLCASSNEKLIEHQRRINEQAPWLSTQRYVSKAQHLRERLLEIGIDFRCRYYESASPYGVGALDKRSTLQDLESALVAAGLQGYDAETIFEQEFEEYKMDPMDGLQTDVLLYTNSKFISGLSANRRRWWSLVGYTVRKIPATNFEGEDILRPVGHSQIVILFDEPDLREFDQYRLVKPEHVEELRSNPMVHTLFESDRNWYEERPADLRFGTGAQKGYGTRQDSPKVVVVTTNPVLADEATKCIAQRTNVRKYTERREVNLTTLGVFGMLDRPRF